MAETNVSSGSYTAGRRRSKPPFARTIRPSSADEPIPAVDALRDQRPQWPTNRRSGCFGNRQLIGHFRHWGRSGSTSAMWRIAGSGSIEQSNGSFLDQRTHTPDRLPTFGPPREQRLFPRSNGHSFARVDCHRTAFPAVRWPTVIGPPEASYLSLTTPSQQMAGCG
jgi:hypothetical protein